jgi:hypothetical protein
VSISPQPAQLSRAAALVIDTSSDESSSDEHTDIEADVLNLRREQKRIKGVLPASWLRIDLKSRTADRPAAAIVESDRVTRKSTPQKGIARKLTNRSLRLDDDHAFASMSDGNLSDSEDNEQAEAAPRMKQTTLVMENVDTPSFVRRVYGDEVAENDWIDPMILGGAAQRRVRNKSLNRQPRISESFRNSAKRQDIFTEERTGHSGARGDRRRRSPTKAKRRSGGQAPPRASNTINLSIMDAPDANDDAQALPQFVRLARRQARKHHDQGRHSPSRKSLRLATSDETAEALTTLKAWRDGSIAPRTQATRQHLPRTPPITARKKDTHAVRKPLSRLSHNSYRAPPISTGPVTKSRAGMDLQSPQFFVQSPQSQSDSTEQTTPNRFAAPRMVTRPPMVSYPRGPLRSGPHSLRVAQLESLESVFDAAHRTAAFERRIRALTNNNRLKNHPLLQQDVPLTRFLQERTTTELEAMRHNFEPEVVPREGLMIHHNPRRRSRKSVAKRLNAESRHYRQPDVLHLDISPVVDVAEPDQPTPTTEPALIGLLASNARYPIDFDILPLDIGTFFHGSTFIGSGEFKAALQTGDQTNGQGAGNVNVTVQNHTFEWGAWTEDVASGFAKIPAAISSILSNARLPDNSADYTNNSACASHGVDFSLRPVLRYLSKSLHFLDPLDRVSCVQELQRLCSALVDLVMETQVKTPHGKDAELLLLQFVAVIAHQGHRLSESPVCPSALSSKGGELVERCLSLLAHSALKEGLEPLRVLYDENKHTTCREQGIKDGVGLLSSIVVLNQMTRHAGKSHLQFWNLVTPLLLPSSSRGSRVADLERCWYDIFTILPALEIDSAGVARIGSRLQNTIEDWSAVSKLVKNVLELYDGSCRLTGSSINEYVRAMISRCSLLSTRWGWRKSESVMNIIYDFFARRKFSSLHNEDSRGSPKFLEALHAQPSLEITRDDRSFHMFLKWIATSLLSMRKYHSHDDRKIGAIAWRFIPNHQRTFAKDDDLQQSDLDSLRNHCDLLCTLYYASPPTSRVSIDVLQSLVDHSNSHSEACRLSVRTWANVTAFQVSTGESIQALDPLLDWLDSIISATTAQYHIARSEVEAMVVDADGGSLMGSAFREGIIAKNQAGLGSILVEALVGLQRALRASPSLIEAEYLISHAPLTKILELFDPVQRRLLSVLSEVTITITTFLDMYKATHSQPTEESQSEDSQEFGDNSALHELIALETRLEPSSPVILDVIYRMVSQFVSNIIGADMASDDELLKKVLDLWLRMGDSRLPGYHLRRPNYMSQYSNLGWNQMRETAQKRKFTPYVIARYVEMAELDEEARWPIFTSWLVSLMQREATLKFQHVLTNSLLNCWSTEPMLQNLPFHKEGSNHKFNVTLAVLRERRLLLISTILSNIRESFDQTISRNPRGLQDIRARYASMLGEMMQAMKTNYQDLQTSEQTGVAIADVQGVYVEFVHHVVSFLQQYILDICPIDRFFTDSAAFPLPAADPSYVIGRLRSYVPKLNQPKTRKLLVTFLQSVSERAAVEGQQGYLINQISSSMCGVAERGSRNAPSLRHVFLTSILPAFVEHCSTSEVGWVFLTPILQACQEVLMDLYYRVRLEEYESVSATGEILTFVLGSITRQFHLLSSQPGRSISQHVLALMSGMLEIGRSCLPLITFVRHALPDATRDTTHAHLENLTSAAHLVETHLGRDVDMDFDLDRDGFEAQSITTYTSIYCPWPDTKTYAEQQIKQANTDCFVQDGRYMLRKGNVVKEMHVRASNLGDEQERFRRTADAFYAQMARVKRQQAEWSEERTHTDIDELRV